MRWVRKIPPSSTRATPPDLLTTVLRHATWKERAAALAVCRAWRNRLLQDDFYYKWLHSGCTRRRLYVPTDPRTTAGWRASSSRCGRVGARGARPDDATTAPPPSSAAISVSARWPSAPAKEDAPPEDGAAVVVPIHQRLKLLRAQPIAASARR